MFRFRSCVTTLAMGLLLLLTASATGQEDVHGQTRHLPTDITIAGTDEPGTRLVLTGILLAAADSSAVSGARIYLYHTDDRGYYAPDDPMANDRPRLKGTIRTDSTGRFTVRTIRPGGYPSGGVPAHIHMEITTPDGGEIRREVIFPDDPNLTERMRRNAARPDGFFVLAEMDADSDAGQQATVTVFAE